MAAGVTVIDCAGIGFCVYTSANTMSSLKPGSQAKLYICEQVREDAFDLYGFSSLAEKHCFELLTSVSGVGPKAAISVLSIGTPESICMAILSEDERALTSAQGIGKRIAQRIILELKDKLQKDFELPQAGGFAAAQTADRSSLNDAMAALSSLGYTNAEASAALKNVDLSASIDNIIRAALRNMMK